MNGDKYLLDTNIVLYILNGEEDLINFLNKQQFYISIITEMELLSFPKITKQEIHEIDSFIQETEIVGLTEQIKEMAITIRRKYKLKLPDSIVAASAFVLDIPLITADNQFKVVSDIQLLIYDPAR